MYSAVLYIGRGGALVLDETGNVRYIPKIFGYLMLYIFAMLEGMR